MLRREQLSYQWHNSREVRVVFSAQCQNVTTEESSSLPAPHTAPISLESQPLLDPKSLRLDRSAIVARRASHEPTYTKRAVRQSTKSMSFLPGSTINLTQDSQTASLSPAPLQEESTELRDTLLVKMAEVLKHDTLKARNCTSGINRQVRHAGVYMTANSSVGAREKQKRTLRDVASKVRNSPCHDVGRRPLNWVSFRNLSRHGRRNPETCKISTRTCGMAVLPNSSPLHRANSLLSSLPEPVILKSCWAKVRSSNSQCIVLHLD